jgi:hypothetical protein
VAVVAVVVFRLVPRLVVPVVVVLVVITGSVPLDRQTPAVAVVVVAKLVLHPLMVETVVLVLSFSACQPAGRFLSVAA